MWSLTLLEEHEDVVPTGRVLAIAHDATSKRCFVVSQNGSNIDIVVKSTADRNFTDVINTQKAQFSPYAALGTPAAAEGNDVAIASFHFLCDQGHLCLALQNGELHTITADGNAEMIGCVDDGILSMAWAPDEELFALVTGAGRALVMTKDFDELNEFSIQTDQHGEQVPVALGWGKKETQFHGKAGKEAALDKGPNRITLVAHDDGRPRVSWRGDGSKFAISSIDRVDEDYKRVVRIYSRDALLQATSEPVDQLHHSLSWRPSGSQLASTQMLPGGGCQVVFFEQNGLRHGEFSLLNQGESLHVRDLAWNSDSSTLLVWLHSSDGAKHFLQLWTTGNYHWYLKQSIELTSVQVVQWDSQNPLVLHIGCCDSYQRLHWTWDVIRSPVSSHLHSAAVAVVDGKRLLHTPFLHANVPPPYSLSKIEVGREIKAAAICQDPNEPDRVAIIFGWNESFLSIWKPDDAYARAFANLSEQRLGDDCEALRYRQLCFVTSRKLCALGFDRGSYQDKLCTFDLDESSSMITSTSTFLPFDCYRLVTGHGFVLIEDTDGCLWKGTTDPDLGVTIFEVYFRLPAVCDWLTVTPVVNDCDEQVIIGQTARSKLVVNEFVLVPDCLTFLVHSKHLIFTTLSHSAHFIPLARLANWSASSTIESFDTRTLERGSNIVTAHPLGTGLVLQMPRGNLETIHPRPLVLDVILRDVEARQWRKAFLNCRKHRVDLNILVDAGFDCFLQCVDAFVAQIDNVDYLNLFLSSLKNDDVLVSMYPSVENKGREPIPKDVLESKVNRVCDSVRCAVESRDLDAWASTIITSFVKKSPPEVECALLRIKKLTTTGNHSIAEKALRYTVFLIPVDQLFDVALGMYDFPLVLMVAQHSHKDPREYLPFLSELKQLPEAYCKFRIDSHLKRYPSAFQHLLRAGEDYHAECDSFMQEHSFFREAIRYYSIVAPNQVRRVKVLRAYSSELAVKGSHSAAALALQMAGDYINAQASFVEALDWRSAFVCAGLAGQSQGAQAQLAQRMAARLRDRTEYNGAATVLLEYAEDIEGAVANWVEGNHWEEAMRYSMLHDRADLVAMVVKPGVLKAFQALLNNMAEFRDDLLLRVTRLADCRKEKDAKLNAMMADIGDDFDNPALANVDVMSDTTSLMSTFTGLTLATGTMSTMSTSSRKSNKSGKARRKAERKRHAGKKGSVFEEEYLIDSAHRIVDQAYQLSREVYSLTSVLLGFGELDRAQKVQDSYDQLLKWMNAQAKEVFTPLKPHSMQRALEAFMLQHDEGLTRDEAERKVDEEFHLKAATMRPPALPSPEEWKQAVLF